MAYIIERRARAGNAVHRSWAVGGHVPYGRGRGVDVAVSWTPDPRMARRMERDEAEGVARELTEFFGGLGVTYHVHNEIDMPEAKPVQPAEDRDHVVERIDNETCRSAYMAATSGGGYWATPSVDRAARMTRADAGRLAMEMTDQAQRHGMAVTYVVTKMTDAETPEGGTQGGKSRVVRDGYARQMLQVVVNTARDLSPASRFGNLLVQAGNAALGRAAQLHYADSRDQSAFNVLAELFRMALKAEPEPCNHAVLVGSPVDGLTVRGPFADRHDALAWAETCGDDFWVVDVHAPEA